MLHLPRYWAYGAVDDHGNPTDPPSGYLSLGWSDISPEDARRIAEQRARRLFDRFNNHTPDPREYPYPDRPIREELVERSPDSSPAAWAITRNAYGALVLNVDNVMFVDIDITAPTLGSLIGRMFGKRKPGSVEQAIQRVREVADAMPDISLRLYRTAAGLRAIITSETYDPASDLSTQMLQAFGADPQYVTLCRAQTCYRARLTPKPWRCRTARPPYRFPFLDPDRLTAHTAWVEQYKQSITAYATCQLIETLGPNHIAAPSPPSSPSTTTTPAAPTNPSPDPRSSNAIHIMTTKVPPRPVPDWHNNPMQRAEDAAYAFGYHLIHHCRDEALATLPQDASPEMTAAVEEAVDTALHNVNDMLEGFWKLDAGPQHTIELVLQVRVCDAGHNIVETQEISPCKLDLPIGYWKWAKDREFR